MSEALTTRQAPASFAPARRLRSAQASDGYHSAIATPALPKVQPGQLWFVELPQADLALSPLEHCALRTANVVVYDRALAPVVASVLPLGGYAEPAAADDVVFNTAAERCRRFARDGWSAVRLVDPRALSGRQRVEKIRRLSGRMLSAERRGEWPMMVVANAGAGSYTTAAAELDQLAEMIDTGGFGHSPALTVIFGSTGTPAIPGFSFTSTNGLAG
jgi:hypothetical protein